MNAKERFSKALQLVDPPDRVPVAPPFQGYWALDAYGVSVPDSLENPQKAVTAITQAQADCPFDAISVVWDWFAFVMRVAARRTSQTPGAPLSLRVRSPRLNRWQTWLPSTQAAMCESRLPSLPKSHS